MKYLIMEIQTAADGSVSHLVTDHGSKSEAEQKYHQVLSYAAVSNCAFHSAVMLTDRGDWIKSETFEHEVTA